MAVQTLAQIIGAIAIAENALIYISNRRERILLFKFLSDALWLVNYLLMGGCTGAVLNGVAMVREAVFSQRGKRPWASAKWILPLFLALTWVSPALEWIRNGAFSWLPVLPTIGSMIFVLGFYSESTLLTKTTSILGNVLWLLYALLIKNYTGMLSNVLMLLSAVVGIVHQRRERRADAAKTP